MTTKKKSRKRLREQIKEAGADIAAGNYSTKNPDGTWTTFKAGVAQGNIGCGKTVYTTAYWGSSGSPWVTFTPTPEPKHDVSAMMRELDKLVVHDLIMGALDTPQAIERVVDWHCQQKALWHRVYKSLSEIAARK